MGRLAALPRSRASSPSAFRWLTEQSRPRTCNGTLFDAAGRFNDIFEPWSGRTSWRWLSVSVEIANATEANALSNAFALMPEKATAAIVSSLRVTAHFVRPDGTRMVQRA